MSNEILLTPAQIQFVTIAQTSTCKIDLFWENKLTRDSYCDRCFYSEPLIDKILSELVVNHSILINPYLITKRCDICSVSLSIIDRVTNCNVCWCALCEFVSSVFEITDEYNLLSELTIICLRTYKYPYCLVHDISIGQA